MTHIKEGEYYLVTTDGWFIAPDGEQYRSAWGKCYIKTTEEIFGFTPQKPSTNWFLCVGNVIIAGCHIHYIMKCNTKPAIEDNFYTDFETKNKVGRIYFAEQEVCPICDGKGQYLCTHPELYGWVRCECSKK